MKDASLIIEKSDGNMRSFLTRFKHFTFNISSLRLIMMLCLCVVAIGPGLMVEPFDPNFKFDPISPIIPVKNSFSDMFVAHNCINYGPMSNICTRFKLSNSFLIPNVSPTMKSILNISQNYFVQLDQSSNITHRA